jgi:fluoride exporter
VLQNLAWLSLAGAAGTLASYGLASLVVWLFGAKFPWGTIAVNATGCFLFGMMWSLAEERLLITSETRLIVLTGFMGAFTTFSTYAFETSYLLRESQWALAAANVAAQNGLGIACVFLGLAAGRWVG